MVKQNIKTGEDAFLRNKSRVVGLTGGIGTGKSTVSGYLREKGCKIIDADRIAHEMTAKGSPLLPVLAKKFGGEILLADGTLDRKKLASIVFSDAEKKKQLDEIMHGKIRAIVEEQIASYKEAGEGCVILDVPLLFETGMDDLCEITLVVDAKEDVRISRVVARDNTLPELVRARIKSQMNSDEKRKRADFVIDNSGGITELYKNIDDVFNRF